MYILNQQPVCSAYSRVTPKYRLGVGRASPVIILSNTSLTILMLCLCNLGLCGFGSADMQRGILLSVTWSWFQLVGSGTGSPVSWAPHAAEQTDTEWTYYIGWGSRSPGVLYYGAGRAMSGTWGIPWDIS